MWFPRRISLEFWSNWDAFACLPKINKIAKNLTGIVTGWFFFLPNYVCQSCLPSKMAVVAENRNCLIFDKCAKLTEIITQVNYIQSIHSIDFRLFILLHQLASSKLSYFVQTCQLARMASTWIEILAKIILHKLHLVSWWVVVSLLLVGFFFFQIMSVSPAFHQKWQLLLKIEIVWYLTNVQN
jgi:hypothetical protein